MSATVTLVTLPDVYWRVKRVIDDPDSGHRQLASAIVTDPGMTARVLRLVNSAYWGLHGRIESVSRAVALLGMLHVHDLVLATSLAVSFRGIHCLRMNVRRFWHASLFRALSACAMARSAGLADSERLFVEGLLSDIGHMVMYQQVPELAARALEKAAGDVEQLPRIERELIGCDYAEVGGALVAAWGLPECFRLAITWQNAPEEAGAHALEASVLHIAGRLAEHYAAAPDSAVLPQLDVVVLERAGLAPEALNNVVEDARMNLGSTAELFALA